MSDTQEKVESVAAAPGGESPVAAAAAGVVAASAIPAPELERLSADIVTAIKTVFDPEISADIYELGLIYRVDIEDDRSVKIDMTLTTPNCPSAAELPASVESAVSVVAGVSGVEVKLVWDPPWDPSRMSDEARAVLDMW